MVKQHCVIIKSIWDYVDDGSDITELTESLFRERKMCSTTGQGIKWQEIQRRSHLKLKVNK